MRRTAAWSMVVVLAMPACRSLPASTTTSEPAVTAATADVRPTEMPGSVTMAVGQTMGIAGRGGEWQVEFDAERLELLTPADRLASPGDAGWVWRAKRAGTAEITFTSRVRCAQPPCAPAAAQISLSVVIK